MAVAAHIFCVGHAVQDFVFGLDELPVGARKFRARSFVADGGGPAATAAVAIARLGGTASLCARVGDDAAGRLLAEGLTREGVDCRHLMVMRGYGSSVSAVFVDAHGERLIVNHRDEAWPARPAPITAAALAGVAGVLVDVRWPEGGLDGLLLAREAGVPGVLDGDAPIDAGSPLLPAASHIAFSAQGLEGVVGGLSPEAALHAVRRLTKAWVCVTLGAEGAAALDARGEIVRVKSFPVRAVDTLGAGDVWHGAFVLRLAEGAEEEEAMRFACAAAALKVSRAGGRGAIPNRAEVHRVMAGEGAAS
jgi:sulfofructose kinase